MAGGSHDLAILMPQLLCAHHIIWNFGLRPYPEDLKFLGAALRFAEELMGYANNNAHAQKKAGDSVFGHLHFVFREADENITVDDMKKSVMDVQKGKGLSKEVKEINEIRELIESYFAEVSFHKVPPLNNNEKSVNGISTEYRDALYGLMKSLTENDGIQLGIGVPFSPFSYGTTVEKLVKVCDL